MLATPTSNPNPGTVVAARAAHRAIPAFTACAWALAYVGTGHKPGPRRHPATSC